MATTTDDLQRLEEKVNEHLIEEAGHVEADIDQAADAPDDEEVEPERPALRLALAVGMPTLAAAIMVGGVFSPIVLPRLYAIVAGALGIVLAVKARGIKKPLLLNLAIVAGLFAIGIAMVLTSPGKIPGLRAEILQSMDVREVQRPPVRLTAGWQAIIGWLMGIVGFLSAWVAIVLKKPALALLLPLPVAAIAAISVPDNQQEVVGIVALALFAFGLGILSTAQALGPDDEKLPASYEIKRFLRALPLVAVIMGLLFASAQLGFLFPDPKIDPTQEPTKPKTVPISEVEDRVLFEISDTKYFGPFRTGGLDVYVEEDGSWRLPPFADGQLDDVPESGIVDKELNETQGQGIAATIRIAEMSGAVLPTLPNTVGIQFTGQPLAYDARNANIRLSEGTIESGITYTVTSPKLPKVDDLNALGAKPSIPKDIEQFTEIPDAPPAAQDLIAQAPTDTMFRRFLFLRNWVLENVTVAGAGVPVDIPPERANDIITLKEGSPFELVALQAMFARWIGLPSRIGYGFDCSTGKGCEEVDGRKQMRPGNGISFVEVYFPGYKWLPIVGEPKKAKPTVNTNPGEQQFNPGTLPSNDIAVQVFVPTLIPPKSIFYKQLRQIILIAIPVVLLALLAYTTYPALKKSLVRGRRRAAAEAAGPRARIALAYAEWRDWATDFGFRYTTDTPLMFLDRFIDDDEHTEFAWLVTRALWGDLQDDVNPDMAASAEELSRALRRRLGQAQPGTVRAVALVSRLSLRHPYAPETDLTRKEVDRVAIPA